ncbi:hypothetical protein QBC40DRAFT_318891 [Triangularia verruculosa]|uniref:Fibronectin type-III domain-containing protein n=1 Tax=Triangularia verruculosa TaxID=2587418 RepID=A0AAN6X7W1_9PEZI|nr:hypothetical protein QBC40DRAFT_318891 [Triangularia verruculosa]
MPALGEDVRLGMLYDARNGRFFADISLWDHGVVNAKEVVDNVKVQNAEYRYSYSLEEARKNSSLSLEDSLSLDLKLVTAKGSASYLNDNNSSTHEARVDVSCTIARRTRRIPQEVLASMKNGKNLDDNRYTHFVAEVIEGGSATLSFSQACSSAEEATKMTDELRAGFVSLIEGNANSKKGDSLFDNVKISYSGAMVEDMNTLSYKLLPLSVIDSKANRVIRSLDNDLVAKTAAALKAGTIVGLKLRDLQGEKVFQTQFPAIATEISSFSSAFAQADTNFRTTARYFLPALRDGNTDKNEMSTQLLAAISLFRQRIELADEYIRLKDREANVLQNSVAKLIDLGFKNHLGDHEVQPVVGSKALTLLLSLGGPSIGRAKHPLQSRIERRTVGKEEDDSEDEDYEDEGDEWFENQQTLAHLNSSCDALIRQHLLRLPGVQVTFGVANIDKAVRPGKRKKTKANIGDIILHNREKLVNVTGMLPNPPTAPTLVVAGQTITVNWLPEREELETETIPATGFVVRYRRRRNKDKDGAFPRATENEDHTEIACPASATSVQLGPLSDDCDYEVALAVHTTVGASDWSPHAIGRTDKQPSVASEMITFFQDNKARLSKSDPRGGVKPWDLVDSSSGGVKKTLFVGQKEVDKRYSSEAKFSKEIAVRIVDVAPEFKPEVTAADITDDKNTVVVVFTGTSGHGKSTEVNAFISYLLGGEVDDPARILVIDDRGARQSESVTQTVTCFRIRPLSSLFEGKTLLVVDTPGFGDTRGISRDAFVTAAMSEFFKTVKHVNAIIFTCKANDSRTTFLEPVATYIFRLFAKNVHTCLRTIYTFSDVGAPLARGALERLNWPVKQFSVEVNNSAFTVELDGGERDDIVRESWLRSLRGQFQILQMLLRAPPVPTTQSAEVVQGRIRLEKKCELTEKKILRTADDARSLITRLDALAQAVGRGPGDKIKVSIDKAVQETLPEGEATTLCINCNFTCHQICVYGDDADKKGCIVMSEEGRCTVCKGKCSWERHKNARFIIKTVSKIVEMVPEDLITQWNSGTNSLEGALIDAMETYLDFQEELRNDILDLAKLNEDLTSKALLQNLSNLINYIDTLIKTAQARGSAPEQVIQLATARNTLILERELTGRGAEASRDSRILVQIMKNVRMEMMRRIKLSPRERAEEEKRACNLYNNLRDQLPSDIKAKAPKALSMKGYIFKGALYPENLKAVIELVKVVLKDGGVVAALVAPKN